MYKNHHQILAKVPLVSRLAIDATFKSSPGQFYQVSELLHHVTSMDLVQVLIVNGFIGTAETGAWAPLFYCLMPKKTRAEYSRLYNGLSEVRRLVLKMHFN